MREQDDPMLRIRAEADACYSWSNAAGYRYAAHRHSYRKILYCLSGSIRFDLEEDARQVEMSAGDRLDLPPGTLHSAVVGPDGVTCIEGQGR